MSSSITLNLLFLKIYLIFNPVEYAVYIGLHSFGLAFYTGARNMKSDPPTCSQLGPIVKCFTLQGQVVNRREMATAKAVQACIDCILLRF